MTYATETDAPVVSIAAGRLVRLVDNALIAIAQRNRRRATFRALSALNDHELDDIGLTREAVNAMR